MPVTWSCMCGTRYSALGQSHRLLSSQPTPPTQLPLMQPRTMLPFAMMERTKGPGASYSPNAPVCSPLMLGLPGNWQEVDALLFTVKSGAAQGCAAT